MRQVGVVPRFVRAQIMIYVFVKHVYCFVVVEISVPGIQRKERTKGNKRKNVVGRRARLTV